MSRPQEERGSSGSNFSLRLLLPAPIRRTPTDLAVVVGLVVVTVLVTLLVPASLTPFRLALALPFLLFAPGYAAISALYPEQDDQEDTTPDNGVVPERDNRAVQHTLDGPERVGLSIGLSLTISTLVGTLFSISPWGLTRGPLVVVLGVLTVAFVGIAVRRRRALDPDDRFGVSLSGTVKSVRGEFSMDTRRSLAVNVLLLVTLVLVIGSVAFAVADTPERSFTELYILSEQDGERVATAYPEQVTRNEPLTVTVGVENHEGRQTNYTLLVVLQRVEEIGNETTVTESDRLARADMILEPNERWNQSQTVRPTLTGTRLRLAYLLYRGDPPADPTFENAYRRVFLWVDVSE